MPPLAGCRQEAVKTVPTAVPSGPAEPLLQLVDPADVARAGDLPVGSKHLPQNCRQLRARLGVVLDRGVVSAIVVEEGHAS
jgi:hypothetical protein